jgi:glucans biosynthesis protein
MLRRSLTRGALLAPSLLLFGASRARPQTLPEAPNPATAFDATTVPELARALATRPHRRRDDALPRALARLDYDGYRRIRFDPAQALWAEAGLPFRLQPHHRGFLFQDRVELFEVAEGKAMPIRYQASQFRFEGVEAPAEDADLGFAGFRLLHPLNRPDHFDELCSFLGASYFRGLGRGQVYGLSARGLALHTAEPGGEEFPAFTAFWIERPQPGDTTATLHALLESASVTGAFRIVVTPGEATVMEVGVTLFARREVPRLGIAPATSMFFFGPADRDGVSDYRPAVHDSDGLLMRSGGGEQIWRALSNPRDLQVSGFQDATPAGFGLLQRARGFDAFQDLEAAYHRRPSLWTKPLGDWGPGEVQLVEIPTQDEIHDNIVAAWRPQAALPAGGDLTLRYRLHWQSAEPGDARLLRFAATRGGAAEGRRARRFVLDTTPLVAGQGAMPEASVEASAGTLRNVVLQPNPETGGLRLAFELLPGSAPLVELRAALRRGTTPVSETWCTRWTA